MIAPVCVKDKIQLRCIKNEALIQEGNSEGNLYYCDVMECPVCKFRVYTGFGCAIDPNSLLGQELLKKNPIIIKY
jgi:hypothetical protein